MTSKAPPRAIYADFINDVLNKEDASTAQAATAQATTAPAPTAQEMDHAEHNFDVVLTTAVRIAALRLLPGFDATKLQSLVRDLKSIFTLVRRTMNERPNCLDYKGTKPVAPPAKEKAGKIPENFRQAECYDCLCPLTLLLQLVAQGLSELNIQFRSLEVRTQERKEREQWGSLMPLRGLLIRMNEQFKRLATTAVKGDQMGETSTSDLCPGLATIIMFHEKNSRYTVTATAPRYARLTGLQKYAFDLRDSYINTKLRGKLPPHIIERIQAVESYSEVIKAEKNVAKRTGRDPVDPAGIREKIGGNNASLANSGKYREACLMDHWRFKISRPGVAQDEEDKYIIANRIAFKTGSCAEWELYVTILANPDPEHPCPPPPAIQRENLNGTPKAPTWEKTAHMNERIGVVKATTFASKPPLRHPAIHQIVTPPQKA